jgi:predicted extracellular nuclease
VAHASCRDRALRLHTDEPPHQRAEPVGGTLKVASFNVLNSFKTIDTTSSGSSGPCGPSGTMDCRGADSEAELERQRAKIVAALKAMDADVAGLIEIQNDDDVTLAHLVEGLNAATRRAPTTTCAPAPIGTDAIKLAFVYKPATVELVGAHEVLDSSVDPRFEDTRSRPPSRRPSWRRPPARR